MSLYKLSTYNSRNRKMAVAQRHKSFPLITPTNNRYLAFKWDRNESIFEPQLLNSSYLDLRSYFNKPTFKTNFKQDVFSTLWRLPHNLASESIFNQNDNLVNSLDFLRTHFSSFFCQKTSLKWIMEMLIAPIFYHSANKIDWQTLTLHIKST